MNSPVLTIISFLIIFTVVVVSHEFGHFLIARINGIRVLEFSIGMGPVLFRKKGKNTDLTIRLLPFGGACMYDGMFDSSEDDGADGDTDGDAETSITVIVGVGVGLTWFSGDELLPACGSVVGGELGLETVGTGEFMLSL